MSRHALRLILGLLAPALAAAGQPEPGDILIGTLAPPAIQQIHVQTRTAPLLFKHPSTAAHIYGLTMDVDNHHLIFTMTRDPLHSLTTGGVWRFDPTTRTVVATVARGPALFTSPRQIVVDPDGDYVLASKGTTPSNTFEYRLLKIDRNTGAVATIARAGQIGQPAEWRGGLVIDIDTGRYLVLDRDPLAPAATRHPLLSIGPSGSIATLGYLPVQPRYGLAQDIRTGDLFAGFALNLFPTLPSGLLRMTRTGVVNTVISGRQGGSRHAFESVAADRSTAASRRLLSTYVAFTYATDLATFTVTSVAMPPNLLLSPRVTTVLHARHVQTIRHQPRLWEILLSYPTLKGKGYRVVLGMSGVRPGLTFADGRHLNLNIDPLTLVSLNNLIPALFNPGPMVLDASGKASATLNLKGVPTLGIPVWVQVVVFDPAAPLGIAVVEDPWVVRV